MGASWEPFGASWEPLGSLLGASWGHLGAFWALLGVSWGRLGTSWLINASEQRVGSDLAPSWGRLGAILVPSWALLGPLGAVLGPLGALLEPSWVHLERLKSQKDEQAKTSKNLNKYCIFGSRGVPRGAQVGPSWGQVAILSALEAFQDVFLSSCHHLVVFFSSRSRLKAKQAEIKALPRGSLGPVRSRRGERRGDHKPLSVEYMQVPLRFVLRPYLRGPI